MQCLLPSHHQATSVSVVQAKKGQIGYCCQHKDSPSPAHLLEEQWGTTGALAPTPPTPPANLPAELGVPCTFGFCSWQGFSVSAVVGIHTRPHGLIPTEPALWLSLQLVLVPALSVGPGMAGAPGLMEPTPIWESGLLSCSRLAAPLSFCPFAGSAVILRPLCLSQCLGIGTWRGDKSPHTRTVIYLLSQPPWAPGQASELCSRFAFLSSSSHIFLDAVF